MSQQSSISSAQLCLQTSSYSWGTFYEELGGRICTLATVKPFTPENILKTQRKLKTHSLGVPPVHSCLSQGKSPDDGIGKKNLRDPHSLMIGGKTQGNLPGLGCGSVCQGGAEVLSNRRRSP